MRSLAHREPDRIPIDLSGHRSSGICGIAYARLRRHLGFPEKLIRIYDPVQQLAIVDNDVLDWFGVDTVELGRAFAIEDKYWTDWSLPDGTPCQMPIWAKPERADGEWIIRSGSGRAIARMPDGLQYFEQVYFPFAEEHSIDDIERACDECMWIALAPPPGPITAGKDSLEILNLGAKRLRATTDRAIVGLFGGSLLETGQFLCRSDNFLAMLAGQPARAHQFLEKLAEMHVRSLERFVSAVGSYLDIIVFADDLGMQSGPQVSPRMYREFFKPRQRLMWKRVKELAPDVRIMLHCCGGVRELLDDLLEAGVEAINPVQISCRGMEPASLKMQFGQRVTFWGGGCDMRQVLNGNPKEVREHVHQLLRTWTPGGGYVFQQPHNIMDDAPPENIVAMFDAVRSY